MVVFCLLFLREKCPSITIRDKEVKIFKKQGGRELWA